MVQRFDCEGSVSLTRRGFLKATAILSFAALPQFSLGASASDTRLLVILLRGGLDGLFAVPPVGDPQLGALRQHINPDDLHALDGFFALHPSLTTVRDLYAKGEALIVHGVSLPYTGRSHFEGQDVMETGVMTPYAIKSGWLGRALEMQGYFSGITMTLPIPLIMRGATSVEAKYPTWIASMSADVYDRLTPLWTEDAELAPIGMQIQADKALLARPPGLLVGRTNSIQTLAIEAGNRLRIGDGPRIAVLDHVGFDTHSNQPDDAAVRMREVDEAIGAFRNAIGDEVWKQTLIVTVTEFGRTAAENGSLGTDHGWGSSIFVLGGKLRRSGIVADWPGLKPINLYEGRDLMATLDARSLYGAVLSSALHLDPERIRRDVLDYAPTTIYDAYL
jgi:uncharacterized protein (DUF1501 family)